MTRMIRPGERFRILVAHVCDAQTMARLIDPAVADLQREYAEAAAHPGTWRRRRVLLGGYMALLKVAMVVAGSQSLRALVSHRSPLRTCPQLLVAWNEDHPRAVPRMLACGLLAAVAVTALFELPMLVGFWSSRSATASTLALVWYAAPQALAIGIIVGFVLGILYGLGGRPLSRRSVVFVLGGALFWSAFSFATINWIVPRANLAFREAVEANAVVKGANELTSTELRQRLAADADTRVPLVGRHDRRYLEVLYHMRDAFSCAALVLSLFVLMCGAFRWRTSARMAFGLAACTIYVGYFFWLTDALAPARLAALSPSAAAWLPNVLAILVAIIWMTTVAARRRVTAAE
jgi:MFS family permease